MTRNQTVARPCNLGLRAKNGKLTANKAVCYHTPVSSKYNKLPVTGRADETVPNLQLYFLKAQHPCKRRKVAWHLETESGWHTSTSVRATGTQGNTAAAGEETKILILKARNPRVQTLSWQSRPVSEVNWGRRSNSFLWPGKLWSLDYPRGQLRIM